MHKHFVWHKYIWERTCLRNMNENIKKLQKSLLFHWGSLSYKSGQLNFFFLLFRGGQVYVKKAFCSTAGWIWLLDSIAWSNSLNIRGGGRGGGGTRAFYKFLLQKHLQSSAAHVTLQLPQSSDLPTSRASVNSHVRWCRGFALDRI